MSISGLHLSLLGLFSVGLWSLLLKRSSWLLLHTHVPTLALVLTAPVMVLYTCVAGLNVPAIRSLATALLVVYAVLLRRQRSLIHLIAAAALVVLIFNPLALFTPSFQLSFAAVLAINLIYPRLPLFIEPEETTTPSSLGTRAVRTVQSMLYVSLAATAGTLPILLYHFNRFSVIGPVMNLLIEPLLCLWALPCGLLAVPLISLLPDLALLLLHIGQPGIDLAIRLTEACAGFPHASIWTITPAFFEIGLFFLLLFLLLRPGLTLRRFALASGLAACLLGSFTWSLWFSTTTDETIVTFLDVGQGSATLVRMPDGTTILIDGGGYQSEQFDPGQNLIAPFLWRNRIWRLDDLIVTHPHQDHCNGLPFVAARFRPNRLIVNGDTGNEPAYPILLEMIRQDGATIHIATSGDILRRSGSVTLECLGMNGLGEPPSTWSTNDRSLVLGLRHGSRGVLFPADIGVASEPSLLPHGKRLQADVLLAPHHGSRTSLGRELLTAVNPALIVVSAGPRQLATLPAPEHRSLWQQKNILVLVTGQAGTITCRTDGSNLSASTSTGVRYQLDPASGRFVAVK